MTDLHWLTAAEIGAAYRTRSLSPVELVTALLARIERHDSRINAFIHVDAEGALEAARQAERAMRSGAPRGPLHGVPVAIKDNIDVAGQETTCHSRIMVGNVAERDAAVVSHLRAAGAIVLGKVALHEFGFGNPTFDGPFPPARNPWNVDHHPAGSSSGSGAAIGAGFVPITLGTDTAGSIRNPGGVCGGLGLKPTNELLSMRGIFPVAYTLDQVGPLARSAEDIALALDALVGPDAAAPAGGYGADIGRGLRGLRIGFVRHFHETDIQADPEVVAALDEAVRVLEREGATVRDVVLPPLPRMQAVTGVIWFAEAWAIHARWLRERPGDYSRGCRRKLLAGAFLTAGDYVRALQGRMVMTDAVNDVFRDVDVLLTGSSFEPTCRIEDQVAYGRNYPRQARSPFSATGHPALGMVCGMSKSGLPLTLQLVGRTHDEVTLLRAAAGYERATPWHGLRPPMAD